METDTSLDCPLMPDGEAREAAIREEIKRADWAVREPEIEDENRELRRKCVYWRQKYYAEKNKIVETDEIVKNQKVRRILYGLYYSAKSKHPEFADSPEQGVCVIGEEFGEMAKEILEKKNGWKTRTLIEAGHVAVTAIRMMEMIPETETEWNGIEQKMG